jgi:hypothetical protein
MLRRIIYTLGAAAVALGIAAGLGGGYPARAGVFGSPPDTEPPSLVDAPLGAVDYFLKIEGIDGEAVAGKVNPADINIMG